MHTAKDEALARIAALQEHGHLTAELATTARSTIERVAASNSVYSSDQLLRIAKCDYIGTLGGRMERTEDGMVIQNAGNRDHYWF